MVKEGCGFTQPWLDLDPNVVKKFASNSLQNPPRPLNQIFPVSLLTNITGKDILCLASGGGQQSAVFGILGAHVTVLDLSDGQLESDKKAASHYGYLVTAIQGDMSNLSMLKDNSFDLVFQAPSMGYVSDVRRVYSEAARVLRPGGHYRADAQNPLSQFVDESSWDGIGYRISVPYSVKEKKRGEDKNVIEYRHYLDETFNGLIDCGFEIEKVQEYPTNLFHDEIPQPGTWLHSELYLPGMFVIVARKK